MPRNSYVPVSQDSAKMRFIEWLTTPPPMREPSTEEEFAAIIDVHPKTLHNWKRDPEFKSLWHDESDEVIGGDDRKQSIIDALYESASDPFNPRHVAAAKEYREWMRMMSPESAGPGEIAADKPLALLTDEEIDDLLARGLQNRQVEFRSVPQDADYG